MSTDTTSTESDGDSSTDSNTDAIIYGTGTCYSSGSGLSLISDPNITSSSSTSSGDDLVIVSGASSSRFKKNDHKQAEIRIFNVDFRALISVSNGNNNNNNTEEEEGLESNKRLKSSGSGSLYHKTVSVVQRFTGSSSSSYSIEKIGSPSAAAPASGGVDLTDIRRLHRRRPSPLSLPGLSKPCSGNCGPYLYDPFIDKKIDDEQEAGIPTVASCSLMPSSWTAIWDCEDEKGIFEVPPLSPLSPPPLPQLLMI